MSILELKEKITGSQVINWVTDPFSRGAYSYGTVKGTDAIKFLSKPVESTIFFAGEAFYDGTLMGTVEAALDSGLKTAKKI